MGAENTQGVECLGNWGHAMTHVNMPWYWKAIGNSLSSALTMAGKSNIMSSINVV